MQAVNPQDVRAFWFGLDRKAWFEKNPAFDEDIRRRFSSLCEFAAAGKLEHWKKTPADRLALMKEIAVLPETAGMPKWAEAHLVIIRRFGRFPHRNAALGRASTPEEADFLNQPGSRF